MRKSALKAFLFAVLILSLFVTAAFAEEATVTGNDVNLRCGPGMNYGVIDCLEKGTVVTVNDRSDSFWYSVTCNGKTGFISASYLSIKEETQTAVVTVPEESSNAGTINAMYVRFRSGPSTEYSILGELNRGTSVSIMGTLDGWSLVSVNGQEGYVFSDYISAAEQAPVAEQAAAPEAVPVSPEPVPAAVPAPQFEVAQTAAADGFINGDYVRLRTGPGTSYSILSSYNRNQPVSVTGSSGEWSQVTVDGQEGYVFTQYITMNSAPAPAAPVDEVAPAVQESKGYIKGTSVRFRAQASLSSAILGEFNTGTELTVTGVSGDWTQAVINGQKGFVYSAYVSQIAPAVSTTGSTEGQKIANYAMQFLGYPYVWAGTSPEEGFDCSGLVNYVYGQFGYNIHRVACDIAGDGVHVEPDQLQPGDVLCFYSSDNYIGHVGIYIGNNQFVHASTYTTGVIVSDLDTSYYANNFEARRIVR